MVVVVQCPVNTTTDSLGTGVVLADGMAMALDVAFTGRNVPPLTALLIDSRQVGHINTGELLLLGMDHEYSSHKHH